MSDSLEEIAAETDRITREARAKLVAAVRQAHRDGMSQREIARRIGRSQPEVSRLIRFHGTGPLARTLRAHRDDVIRIIEEVGGTNVRVFGSVATGKERPDSDIDLMFSMGDPMSLFDLSRLEITLEDALNAEVDLVPDTTLRPGIRDRVLGEAAPL